jgi:DNA-binding transcriptional LysR family regulator
MSSIRVLKTFLAVVEHGSFAAAGDRVGLTPAAVALQIKSLEEDLKQVLFDRRGRSVVLNTNGRASASAAADVVARYEAIASNGSGGLTGTVAVGALISSLMGPFGSALWELKNANSGLEVKLFFGLSADFSGRVEKGELDIAVITKPPRPLPKSLRWTLLYTEPLVLVAPRKPLFKAAGTALEMLREAPFLRFNRSAWTGHLVDEFLRKAGVVPNDAMVLNDVSAIATLVRQGFGVSVLPQLSSKWAQDPELRIIPIPRLRVVRHVGLLERTVHSRSAFTDALKAYSKRTFSKER